MLKEAKKIKELLDKYKKLKTKIVNAKSGNSITEAKKEMQQILKKVIFLKIKVWIKAHLIPILAIAAFFGMIILLMIASFIGNKKAMADEGRGMNVPDVSHEEYLLYEERSYTKQTDTDHSYIDEFEYRLPWAVMEEIDSELFCDTETSTATKGDWDRWYEALKTEYLRHEYKYNNGNKIYGDDGDGDVIITYKYKQVGTQTVGEPPNQTKEPIYEWVIDDVKFIKRHLIYEARTWEGTFTRTYTRKTYDQSELQPTIKSNPEPNATYQVRKIWEFETVSSNYDHSKFDEFVKTERPEVWNTEIEIMKDAIYAMLQIENPVELDAGLDQWMFGQYDMSLLLSGGEFLWPSATSTTITSPFGMRFHPVKKVNKLHTGIDIGAAAGTPVLAARDGTVALAGWGGGYGNLIVIYHGTDDSGNKIETWYAHNSSINVSVGQQVQQGDIIGKVGSTGWSTGPHIHFEIRINGKCEDPMNFFAPPGFTPVGSKDIEEYISKIPNNSQEMDMFIRLINAEGGGTGDKGIMAICEVVLNRLRSPLFNYKPKTLYTVIYATNQFEVVAKGTINNIPEKQQYERIKRLIKKVIEEKTNYARGATFFCSYPAGSSLEMGYVRANRVVFNGAQYGANRFYSSIQR